MTVGLLAPAASARHEKDSCSLAVLVFGILLVLVREDANAAATLPWSNAGRCVPSDVRTYSNAPIHHNKYITNCNVRQPLYTHVQRNVPRQISQCAGVRGS